MTNDILQQIEQLQSLADWYRSWAAAGGGDGERDASLRLAQAVETRLSELKQAQPRR